MKHLLSILLIACVCVGSFAQTPYESFAPETSRPMLELPEPESSPDTLFCAIVADLSNQTLLLVDVSSRRIIATSPITDDLRKWLSVDPLSDKYPGISPYAYAAWNPIKYVDPDGRDTLHFDAKGNYTHRVQSEGSHVGLWHKSNNSTREFRFQDPNDANRFMTSKEYENRISNGETSANNSLLGIMPVSLSSVYKATRPSISDRLKGRYIAALSGKANGSMDYMRLNEPNYNMAENAQQRLMLVDGIPLAQQPYNMGNMLWGLKMHRLGFSLPACLLGAHAYTIYGGMTGKYPKIELDSFDDQCSITLGYMLWPGL